ncbi:MAG: ATP-dependent Clp protease adaptor ClpS [Bradyrhizobiaceae bacterium]|nr:ATP-dependent Clp protease adaptor ClpS [Bradyrhizobiaceae bacterium]
MAIETPEIVETELQGAEVLADMGVCAKVILFNDDVHSYDEVIQQLIKATGCSYSRACALTVQVDTTGKAMVFDGELAACLRVSHILEDIELHTQVEF